MTPAERRAALSLAAIYATRMLGLFMILPVFALYAEHLEGVTPTLVGLAIGVYGLTQAVLQIPFGMLSDRIGRKPVITGGLLVFAAGSVVAAVSHTIWGVIAGRALQGAGAVASALMALVADLTREEHRLKAMATIGGTIGLSFAVALVVGPVVDAWVGVPGIFWLTALLALAGVAVLHLWVPRPARVRVHRDAEPVAGQFGAVLGHPELLRLDLGVFVLHLLLTASFVAVPLALRDLAGLDPGRHWLVYLGVMLVALAGMVPLVVVAERRRKMKEVFVAAVGALVLAELLLDLGKASLWGIVGALTVFFVAFNVLEATLPSLVAKWADPDKKGTAMGVYASSQFLGAFAGGALGGWLHGAFGLGAVFLACAALAALWLAVAATMAPPPALASRLLPVAVRGPEEAEALAARLRQVPGVVEAVVVPEDGVAYLKVDSRRLDAAALEAFRAPEAGGAPEG
ncbi:MAG: MFS transporter, partial [Gammaproteobacteria bacterium]